jgi:hypothetical protein
MKYLIAAFLLIVCRGAFAGEPPATPTPLLDTLSFGNDSSEALHQFQASLSEPASGALGERSRRLLPGGALAWQGGTLKFTMRVDPKLQTYLTVRFWGGESSEDYLILFCEAKQVGYRHLGDIDVLGLPDEEPRYSGRFYYITTPLPPAMTLGKTSVQLEIRATGPIWGYGNSFDQYQKPMTRPSSNIYRAYTHTDGCFVPPADEKQGAAPPSTPRTAPGAETIDLAKARINKTIADLLKSKKPLNQMQLEFLAKVYWVKWSSAHQNPKVIEHVIDGVDNLYRAWKKDPDAVWQDRSTWNPGWFGAGPAGDAVRLLGPQLQPSLDQALEPGITRRAGWSSLFQASRDWLSHNRRWLANQAMFTDTNLYLSNRAVAVIDPTHAWPEAKAMDYMYQSAGIVPWLGPDGDHGPEKPFGDHFYEVTDKGLTRELGYVGSYGEGGTAGVMEMYEATRQPGGDGDPQLKKQLAKMIRARGVFRYPSLDDENHPAMRLETGVGWRDTHFPGQVLYVQRVDGEQSALRETAATMDPFAIGYAQQMFADNQFFASVAGEVNDHRFRSDFGLLYVPDEYELIKAQPASPHRLPMSPGQPDFVFADETDGVVAIKNHEQILFVSLYWQAQYAVNSLARVNYFTPAYQQLAVVHEDVMFNDSGKVYTRPDWINFGFGNGGTNIKYPSDLHQAYAGQKMPIAASPPGVVIPKDYANYWAGKCEFYSLRFGSYLIAMNTTPDKTFGLQVPASATKVTSLTEPTATVAPGAVLPVAPRSTVVLYLGN